MRFNIINLLLITYGKSKYRLILSSYLYNGNMQTISYLGLTKIKLKLSPSIFFNVLRYKYSYSIDYDCVLILSIEKCSYFADCFLLSVKH